MKTINKILFTVSSFFFTSPIFAGVDPIGGVDTDPVPPLKLWDGIDTILESVMKVVFPVAGLACVIFIIIGGYTWIASAGDPAKVKLAQGTLTWAIIGLVFVLIAALVISTIMSAVA